VDRRDGLEAARKTSISGPPIPGHPTRSLFSIVRVVLALIHKNT
jgi:hypothetical protein